MSLDLLKAKDLSDVVLKITSSDEAVSIVRHLCQRASKYYTVGRGSTLQDLLRLFENVAVILESIEDIVSVRYKIILTSTDFESHNYRIDFKLEKTNIHHRIDKFEVDACTMSIPFYTHNLIRSEVIDIIEDNTEDYYNFANEFQTT